MKVSLRTLRALAVFAVFIAALLCVYVTVSAPYVAAQTGSTSPPGGGGTTPPPGGSGTTCSGNMLCNPLKVGSIEELILTIIDVILVFLLPVIILYIMYAGYLFVTAQGNSGEISAARKALLTALIGGVIVLGARAILDVVKGTIEAVTGDTSMLDTNTPAPTGGSGGAGGGSGGNGGSGGGSGNTNPTTDATFSNYAVGTWIGSGVGKVPVTETMPPQSFNSYYSTACSVCYADFNTLATGVNRCIGKDLPVGAESFESMCTRYKGFSGRDPNTLVRYTLGDEQYIKYVCWVNPSITTDCSAVPRHSYYQ